MGQFQDLGGNMVAWNLKPRQTWQLAFSDANYSSLSNFFDFTPRSECFALIFTNE